MRSYPILDYFFIFLSICKFFRMHTFTTNPGMLEHVTERLLMTCCHAQTKWERSRANKQHLNFPTSRFDFKGACVFRTVHSWCVRALVWTRSSPTHWLCFLRAKCTTSLCAWYRPLSSTPWEGRRGERRCWTVYFISYFLPFLVSKILALQFSTNRKNTCLLIVDVKSQLGLWNQDSLSFNLKMIKQKCSNIWSNSINEFARRPVLDKSNRMLLSFCT